MDGKSQHVTILFADICKSAQVYEILGDHEAQRAIGMVLTQLTEITGQFHGEVIKNIGDAVMSRFDSIENAMNASQAMQASAKRNYSSFSDSLSINIHIGFHYGPVIADDGDLFGDAVNIAARVADYAKPRQIITTKTTIEQMSAHLTPFIRYVADIKVKNISEAIVAYEILWDKKEMTAEMNHQRISDCLYSRLDLTIGNQTIVVDNKRPMVTIGRMNYNDVVIDFSWVSRSHLSIEYRKGIFIIADKSSNGTFIYPENEEMKFLIRSENLLSGRGCILLGGEKGSEDNNVSIKYELA